MKKAKAENKQIKKLMKNKSLLIISLLCCLIQCKKRTPDNYFQNSLLPIRPTTYKYNDYEIYKIGVNSNIIGFNSFLKGGYFAFKNHAFYDIFIDKRCSDDYKQGNYIVNDEERNDKKDIKNIDCDITIRKVFDTNAIVGDTVSQITPEFEWSILKSKFIANTNDTTFIFEQKIDLNRYFGFVFSYSKGFIGTYNIRKNVLGQIIAIEKAYGNIYEDKLKELYYNPSISYETNFTTIFKDVNLSDIKEFKNVE